ncbi:MAG: PilZ domain-containing protein [Nitrospira sp.]|nr:PilZ domain-containing protein [Nitrospira sp.]
MSQPKVKRSSERFPYKKSLTCFHMTNTGLSPRAIPDPIESLDVSNEGMKIRFREWSPKIGAIVQIRIPIMRTKVSMPIFALIRWSRQEKNNIYQAGLQFIA